MRPPSAKAKAAVRAMLSHIDSDPIHTAGTLFSVRTLPQHKQKTPLICTVPQCCHVTNTSYTKTQLQQSMQGWLHGGRFLHGADHTWTLSTQHPSVVPIIPLPGTTLPRIRLDSSWNWYHIMKKI